MQTLLGHTGLVRALACDPATQRLVSASYDRTIKLWDLASGKLLREFKDVHASHIFDVKFDACKVISASHDRRVAVLDFAQGLDAALFL